MIASYIEEGLHYQLFKRQSIITSYREEGLNYQLVMGQSMINNDQHQSSHYIKNWQMLDKTGALQVLF